MRGSRPADPWRGPGRRLLPFLALVLALMQPSCAPHAAGSGTPPDTPAGDGGGGAAAGGDMAREADWKEVDLLVAEQKYEQASRKVGEILEAARAAGDEDDWTRALIREVQLRTALHGYETAVRFLREEAWPEDAVQRAVLDLFYAHGLVTYARAYSWEIEQRERVETGEEVDLRRWTRQQIVAEAQSAFLDVWRLREAWGAESLGPLAEYLDQNSYPARIRGTLRDAVTYLWVELLADTSLWQPGDSREIYLLDAAVLVAGDPAASVRLALDDPDVHPLAKIGAVLDDLETWHRRHRRPEAAFEARLERLRRLRSSFERSEDVALVRADLERHLERLGRRFEWWSMGMAELADMAEEPVEARRIALEGAAAHPQSIGGQRCRHKVAAIEAQEFSLHSMTTDAPDKRSILVHHRNLPALHFRAWEVDLEERLRGAKDYSLLPVYTDAEALMRRRQPTLEWTTELPATPDYQSHQTYVTPPVEKPGLYFIVASARRDFAEAANRMSAVNLLIGDLVLLTRVGEAGFEVTVRSGAGGETLSGVEVSLWRFDYRRGHSVVARETTGDEGRVTFAPGAAGRQNYFVTARRGDEWALDTSTLRVHRRGTPLERTATLVYTDRSVYRPQQTLFWKTVAYRGGGEEDRYRVLPGHKLTMELVDANSQVVDAAAVQTNEFGSASGEFAIPAGRLLGDWQVRASIGGLAVVKVEEYKRPTFEVTLQAPETPLRLNREATFLGEARYYFGLPVTGGQVAWRVTREPVYPRWWWWEPPRPSHGTEVLAAGVTRLDADGRFRVTFLPAADERDADRPGVSYRYRLSADVTDEGGETRSASESYRLGFVAVEATLDTEAGFFRRAGGASLTFRRTDLDGAPRAGNGSWRLFELAQPDRALLPAEMPVVLSSEEEPAEPPFRTPGDLLQPRWAHALAPEIVLGTWRDGAERASGEVEHGDDGEAVVAWEDLPPGAYRLRYTTRDEFGALFETSREFVVAAPEATRLTLAAALLVEQPSVAVGGTARVLVHSGLEAQQMVLEIFRDDRQIERRALTSAGGLQIVELPIGEKDRGGLGLRLTAVRDHQLLTFSASIQVPWDDRKLALEFATFRDLLRPGARETWRVRVKGADEALLGERSAELLAYMYDRSLDLFASHNPPDLSGFYRGRGGVDQLQVSLGSAGEVWRFQKDFADLPGFPGLSGDRLKFFDGYPIGGPGRRGGPGGDRFEMMRMRAPAAAAMEEEGQVITVTSESPMLDQAVPAPAEAGQGGDADGPPQEPVELRADFSETAFWEPHLVLDEGGGVAFEFTVPDSVTEWNVWVHALTRDLRAGSITKQTRSVKELMVRPYLPRFLREGDRAEIKVVLNNASERELAGELDFEIVDPETDRDLRAEFGLSPAATSAVPFRVTAGGGTDLSFPVTAPARVGEVAFRVVARAGDLSDGELRPLPLLPGRLHLAQSRFATLRDRDRRELRFADLAADDDPTRIDEQLVVTLDGQLFYSVLAALPYLVNYPYECTEQTLNRFLSTGIVSSLYDEYPAVARMAKKFSERDSRYETWDAADPNRKMALEETPWLLEARGGDRDPGERDLIKVLDPRIAEAERRAALAKLERAQTAIGGFPWWPGGPPSPYMTLYLLQGFSRALEFGVEVPRPMVARAWSYMHRHYLEEMVAEMLEKDCCWETVTFLNFVLSSYPDASWTGGVFTDAERDRMLEFSFGHWKQHSPRLKAYLALTLARAGRAADAGLVFDSIMDSAKTERDLGTYWAPEERAWLWYNDTIESHAFVLRALNELGPEDARRHGLVQWLLLNKKLSHWKSTRATGEVLYSLVHYLEREGALGVREEASVAVGPRRRSFVFEPDEYTGKKKQVVVAGDEIEPATMSTIVVEKETRGLLFASATWHFSTDRLPEEARGDFFLVERRYFKRASVGDEWVLEPLAEGVALSPGDQVEVHLSIRAKHAAEYVHLRDPRAAGFEPESTTSRYKWDLGLGWYEEIRDSGTNFFFDWLPAGEYTFKYRLRANLAGAFKVAPATLQSMYAPEFTAYSAGRLVEVAAAE